MLRQILAVAVLLMIGAARSSAGGPAFVAGSGYAPGVKGQPLIWANASVQYFTDQGDLSPILTNAQANAFVANTFSSWTSLPGVALTASQGGELAEDVNGTNVIGYPDGTYSIPTDIQPAALATPVGIVYDYDGQVTDALLGAGAGGSDYCFTNAVYGGPDNFSTAGNIVHALVVINGVCATATAQLPDVQYRLVRTLGRVLGVGWSQANLNVITGNPAPGHSDFEGFPLMHFTDPISCVPISVCYVDAAVPKMDDSAVLGKLYPVAGQPPTGAIHGSVYFTDGNGNAAQPMQGVNVVARLIDTFGQPSRQYVVTSVSGFAFRGNAGNIINGYVDGSGLRYDRFGSDDPALEGFFTLPGLLIPSGHSTAQYQLSVEAVDANWSDGVGPYAPSPVLPSGSFAPVVVTVQPGTDVERDILMLQSAVARAQSWSGATYSNPALLPQGGGWGSWISGYGDADWFQFTAQANRTASVAVTARDESGQPTESKLMPVIGIWQLSDESGNPAPAATPAAFNTLSWGMSRLDAQFGVNDTFRVGISDARGDGRPDYAYVAQLLYSDTVTPARLSVAGGPVTLNGIGFAPGLQVSVAGTSATVLSASANQMQAQMPAGSQDGTATIVVTDPVSGAFSQMIDAITYGASATDQLLLVQGAEPATPVGSVAANPIRVRVVASDGVTQVNGATIVWSATNGVSFSACNGGTGCSVLSDQSGEAATWVTPTATGASTITATLAPASYTPPQSKQATLLGTSSTLDLAAMVPTQRVGQGATIDVPLTVEVLNLGVPQANVVINFTLTKGTAQLSSGTATTNSSGYATITAHLTNHSADVQVSACVAPNNAPCQTFTLFATPASLWTLETLSGSTQVVPAGQSFQPLVMRVTDGSTASNPVMGVSVVFATTLARVPAVSGSQTGDDGTGGGTGMPIILGFSSTQVVSTQDGLASIVPSPGSVVGPCEVFIAVSGGPASAQFHLQIVAAIGERPTRTAVGFTRSAGLPSSALQDAPYSWFVVPVAGSDGQPPADSPASPCSESAPAIDSSDPANPTPSSSSGVENVSHEPCSSSKSSDSAVRQKPVARQESVVQADSDVHARTAEAAEKASPITSRPPDDKRSCRFAQAEEGISP